MECKFFHTLEGNAGFAVMTHNFQFFVVGDSDRSRDELRVKKLADLPGIRDNIVLTRTTADVFIQYIPQFVLLEHFVCMYGKIHFQIECITSFVNGMSLG